MSSNLIAASDETRVLLDRREFVGAAVATIATPFLGARSSVKRQARVPRPTVAVFGGGVAGLTVAHELAERGFGVTVYERRAWGGKARSMMVPGTAQGGREPLPSEHGYRFEFGFYQNLPDTLRRIPTGTAGGVFDRLVECPQVALLRAAEHDLVLPIGSLDPRPYTPLEIFDLILGVVGDVELPPSAVAYFAQRLLVFMTSCDERRNGEWEKQSWSDFIATAAFPDDYRRTLGELPRFFQASKADSTSARFVAWVLELLINTLLGRGANGRCFRCLNGPTTQTWIDPWLEHLTSLGVNLRLGDELTALEMHNQRISAARLRTPNGSERVTADWYVMALPVERARKLWNPSVLAADPTLAAMNQLSTGWMNGVMLYLNQRPRIVDGDAFCTDSPWAITFVPQAQFWSNDLPATYGDGRTQEKLSAIIADWTTPGTYVGKPARDCTPGEIVHEVWGQIKAHVNSPGQTPTLTDSMLITTNIDPGMLLRDQRLLSQDPLMLPRLDTAQYRPDVTTAIPNLLLTGDYLNGDWEVGNMEAANTNGRRAANAILSRCGSTAAPAATQAPYQAPEFQPLKAVDRARYLAGEPNLLDTALPLNPDDLRSTLTAVRTNATIPQ